ncbi:MAG: hypothetical protein ABFS86_20295 [Planctomycetota bacterium]
MDTLEIRNITVANLPDLVSPCILAGTLDGKASVSSESADRMTRGKLAFFHERMRQGAAAMAAYRGPRVVGLLEYYPIEVAPTPVEGEDLFVINCLQVPHAENREVVEKELVAACVKDWSTRKGVVVLARQKRWDVLGFEEVLRDKWPEGDERVLWLMKFWEVEEPRLTPFGEDYPNPPGRVRVDVFESGHCPWDFHIVSLVEEVCEDLGPVVLLEKQVLEDRTAVLRHGVSTAVAVNGRYMPWFRPHPIPTRAEIKSTIESTPEG